MHQANTEPMTAQNETTKPAEPSETKPTDTSREETTVIVPRVRAKRRFLTYAILGITAIVAGAGIFHACNAPSKGDSAETPLTRTVFSGSPQRKLKLVDASKCRRDQIRIVDNALVTDPDCTVVVYEDIK